MALSNYNPIVLSLHIQFTDLRIISHRDLVGLHSTAETGVHAALIPPHHDPVLHDRRAIEDPLLLLLTASRDVQVEAFVRRRGQGLTAHPPRVCRPLGGILLPLRGNLPRIQSTRCDVFAEQRSHEDPIGRLGLIGRDHVAGLVDAGEGEISKLSCHAS